MIYDKSDIVKDVRIILDENMDSRALIREDDIDTLSLDEVIASKILEAAADIEKQAPAHLLGIGYPFGDDIIWRDRPGHGPGYVILPGDFMRLVTFRMSDWAMPVTGFITEDSPLYARMQSRYPGISGNPQAPVVAIVQDAANRILEFYSCAAGEGTHIRKARYLPYPKFDAAGGVEIPKYVYTAVLYYTAALTCVTFSATDQAKSLIELSKSKLQ